MLRSEASTAIIYLARGERECRQAAQRRPLAGYIDGPSHATHSSKRGEQPSFQQSMPLDQVKCGTDVSIRQPDLVNLYGCTIGDGTRIGAFVEIQKNAVVGARCKISSHTFICEGVTIDDEVFVGHGVMFINDRFP